MWIIYAISSWGFFKSSVSIGLSIRILVLEKYANNQLWVQVQARTHLLSDFFWLFDLVVHDDDDDGDDDDDDDDDDGDGDDDGDDYKVWSR